MFVAELGVIIAGSMVALTGSRLPELVIGLLLALVVVRRDMLILQDARATRNRYLEQG